MRVVQYGALYEETIDEIVERMINPWIVPWQPIINSIAGGFQQINKDMIEWSKPYRAIILLGKKQYVYWEPLEKKFIDTVVNSSNLNKTLRELNVQKNFSQVNDILAKCLLSPLILPYQKLFVQAIQAFNAGSNDLAILGFISVIDGLLSDVSENISTSFFSRIDPILKKLEQDETIEDNEYKLLALVSTFRDTMQSFSKKVIFSEKEPANINRNWIMHGRSRRRKTKLDCIKMIRFIYGTILINDIAKKG